MRNNSQVGWLIKVEERLIFGRRIEGISYTNRPSVYAVIMKRDVDAVAVVKTPIGYFLPGGGVENDESHEDCLLRECLEELGSRVSVGDYIGRAGQYYYSKNQDEYLISDGYFYFATIEKTLHAPLEEDHELIWVMKNEVSTRMSSEQQIWAVRIAFQIANSIRDDSKNGEI
jgi:8-oxo-dGTP diphosphatase